MNALFERACSVIPGGVNSPVRAFKSVGGTPFFTHSASGVFLKGEDGKSYLDFCASWGPLLFGHAHPQVIAAISEAAMRGTSFGTCTAAEVEFAERLIAKIPYAEQVRLVNSGTEAVMTALRLARGVSGRRKILKFEGGYHGHSDSLLVSAGSALLEAATSSSAGVTEATAHDTYVVPYNDIEAVSQVVAEVGHDLAAIIVEPIAGNMGLVIPKADFLQQLRHITRECGALLIFDEVITGFRLGSTTYGELCGVEPDITTLGKIIGGGLPLGALAGRRRIMEQLAPCGPVYQAGTLSGNPLCVAAGMAMLDLIEQENPYERLAIYGTQLRQALLEQAKHHGIALTVNQIGGLFTIFFCENEVTDLKSAQQSNLDQHRRFFHAMLKQGIYLPPAQFEVAFISALHTEEHLNQFLAATDVALAQLK